MKGGDAVGVWNFYHSQNDPKTVAIFKPTIKTFEPSVKAFELNKRCFSQEEQSPTVKHIVPITVKKIERHYYHHYYVYQPVIKKEMRCYHHKRNRSYKCPRNYSYESLPK